MTGLKKMISVIMSSAIFSAVLFVSALPSQAETPKLSGSFTYIHNETGLTIVKCKAAEIIQIPADIDGETVTAVQNDAFKQAGAKTISIPATVTDLGDGNVKTSNSLFSSSVEEIIVDPGNAVYTSSDGALFRDGTTCLVFWPRAKAGNSIQIPESIVKIAPYAFSGNKNITSVSFAGADTVISEGAFYGCSALSSITLPSALTAIGDQAFRNCSSLAGITFPSTLTYIGNGAFSGCTKLTSVDSLAQLSDDALASLAGASKTLTVYLPDGSVYKTDASGALTLSSSVPVMPEYEETTAPETTAVETTPPETTADPDETTAEETTAEETSAETTLAETVTISPPETKIDPSIGVGQTDSPDFMETTAKDTETVTEPETIAPDTVPAEISDTNESRPYETVYYVEPKPSVFEQISADLTLVWILGGAAVACAAAAAIYLAVTKIRSNAGLRPSVQSSKAGTSEPQRHSKYYDR